MAVNIATKEYVDAMGNGTQLLNSTSISTTEASYNVAWDSYALLIFAPGISGNMEQAAVVPSSFFANTTSSIKVILPVQTAAGAHSFTIEARQNGSGKIYAKLTASTGATPRLRVYGLFKL